MLITDEVLHMQESRINRARRLNHRGDNARDIGIEHSRALVLLPMKLAEPGSLNSYFHDSDHHQRQASRAFDLARKLYQRAEAVRQGIA